MTLETFLRRLAKTPRTWRVRRFGFIRDSRGRCPLQAVFSDLDGAWVSVGQRTYFQVISAADVANDRTLRARLLRACGLKERKP